jgi:hypothetical protein
MTSPLRDITVAQRKIDAAKAVHLALLQAQHGVSGKALNVAKRLRFEEAVAFFESAHDLNAVYRSAVEGGSTDSSSPANWVSDLAPVRNLGGAFVGVLDNANSFDRMVGDMQPGVMHASSAVLTALAVGGNAAEGGWKPMTDAEFGTAILDVRKVAALAAVSRELERFGNSIVAVLNRALQNATALATDANFLAQLISDNTPVASVGPDLAGVVQDVSAAFAAVSTGSASRLYWVMSSANAKKLVVMYDVNGQRAFPEMTPQGGTFYSVPVIVSDAASTNVFLVDAYGFAGDRGTAILTPAREASLQLNDNPSAGAQNVVNLFQVNGYAIRAERYFAFKQLRSDAAYVISSVDWQPAGSPS